MNHMAYIALGSNLNGPIEQLKLALQAIDAHASMTVQKVSAFYLNPPLDGLAQPDYVNAVASIETVLSPLEMLDALQGIEREQGRVRVNERWAPRTLDLDILLYDSLVIETDRLTIPHPGIESRAFFIHPLAELSETLVLPSGVAISALRDVVSGASLQEIR